MRRILLDENLPRKLREFLPEFATVTVSYAGWSGRRNGDLLKLANEHFDVLLTTDKGMAYQNNLTGFDIAVVQISVKSNRLADIVPFLTQIKIALKNVEKGRFVRLPCI